MESNTKSNMESIAESKEANKAVNTEPSKTDGIIGAEEFSSFYPDISLKELLESRDFSAFAEGKLEKESVASVYKKYEDFTKRLIDREKEKLAVSLANKLSSVGSLSNANPPEESFYTREQVRSMSRSQIKANYEKIRKSQEKWK